MDFVDWCSFVLNKLVEISRISSEIRLRGLENPRLAGMICGEELAMKPEYWISECGKGLQTALQEMDKLGIIEHPDEDQFSWRVTQKGRELAEDMIPLWKRISQIRVESRPAELLRAVNRLSQRIAEDHAWVEPVDRDTLLPELGWSEDLFWSSLEELEQLGLVHCPGISGNIDVSSTYYGIVWETKRDVSETRLGTSETPQDELEDFQVLYRRTVFDRDLLQMTEDAHRSNDPLTLVIIDLDKFKPINDKHGHLEGDKVLREYFEVIKRRAKGKGKAYRLGGDEVGVLFPNYSVEEGKTIAEKFRQDVEESSNGRIYGVTASFGLACLPENAVDADALFNSADMAMYAAKNSGGNRVCLSPQATN
jgi:diguanylate cyclase (GGDEF)-like protein